MRKSLDGTNWPLNGSNEGLATVIKYESAGGVQIWRQKQRQINAIVSDKLQLLNWTPV